MRALESRLGYFFSKRDLLREAFVHSTYSYEHGKTQLPCNERLEFLGDLVLGLTMGKFLFETLPQTKEGELTKLKAQLVCEPTLARVAEDFGLPPLLLLGRGEEQSKGREKASNLANCLEALFGAICEDSSFEEARRVVLLMLKPYIKLALNGSLIYDFKSQLLEKIQRHYHSSQLQFRLEEAKGPDHAPTFTTALYLEGEFLARGQASSKKAAEQEAAKKALQILGSEERWKRLFS